MISVVAAAGIAINLAIYRVLGFPSQHRDRVCACWLHTSAPTDILTPVERSSMDGGRGDYPLLDRSEAKWRDLQRSGGCWVMPVESARDPTPDPSTPMTPLGTRKSSLPGWEGVRGWVKSVQLRQAIHYRHRTRHEAAARARAGTERDLEGVTTPTALIGIQILI
jgi:hypothetical protein